MDTRRKQLKHKVSHLRAVDIEVASPVSLYKQSPSSNRRIFNITFSLSSQLFKRTRSLAGFQTIAAELYDALNIYDLWRHK